jgi:hypothetical protein
MPLAGSPNVPPPAPRFPPEDDANQRTQTLPGDPDKTQPR